MVIRCVFRFNWGTVAGWSEEIFLTTVASFSEAAIYPFVNNYRNLRVPFLAENAILLDVICNDVDDPTSTITIGLNTQGVAGIATGSPGQNGGDPVFAAVRVKVSAAGGKPRVYHFRALADRDVDNGRVNWGQTTPAPFNAFVAGLVAGTSGIRRMFVDPPVNIDHNLVAEPNQFVVNTLPDGIALEDAVRIQTRVTGNGPAVYYTGKVIGFTPAVGSALPLVQVTGWRHGTCEGGKLALFDWITPNQTSYALYTPNWAVYKKTGRAFTPFRGRASPRA